MWQTKVELEKLEKLQRDRRELAFGNASVRQKQYTQEKRHLTKWLPVQLCRGPPYVAARLWACHHAGCERFASPPQAEVDQNAAEFEEVLRESRAKLEVRFRDSIAVPPILRHRTGSLTQWPRPALGLQSEVLIGMRLLSCTCKR